MEDAADGAAQPHDPAAGGAVVFDMDGVLVLTTPVHLRVWEEWFAQSPYSAGPAGVVSVIGRRGEDVLAEVMGPDFTPSGAADIIAQLHVRLDELLADEPLPLAPGAEELVSHLAGAGVPLALATSARRATLPTLIGPLLPSFDVVVTSEDVAAGKPNPEVYATAAQRLDAAPQRCTVVEDTVPGIAAARSAGMRVVAVTTTAPRDELEAAGAQRVVDSLDELTAETLLGGVL